MTIEEFTSSSINRNPIKQYFLTVPQTQLTKEQLRVLLIRITPLLTYHCIAQETHADGGKHLHAAVKLLKGLTKINYLKQLQNALPEEHRNTLHLRPTRNPKAAHDYLHKEDPSPLTYGTPTTPYKFKPQRWHKEFAKELGIDDLSAFIIEHSQKIPQPISSKLDIAHDINVIVL